jgi:phosphatidylglycerophosphate synthase
VTFEEHLERWQALHGGIDPRGTPMVVPWLRVVHVVAGPLARLRTPPDAITLGAVLLAGTALLVPAWPAALLIVLSALLDGLDGAVALLSDRVTARGALLDTLGDRASDLLFVAALVVAGAPWWLGVACGAGILLLEGQRAWAGSVLTVTVAERPTRVIATALGLVSVPLVGLGVLTAATVVGLLQLRLSTRSG